MFGALVLAQGTGAPTAAGLLAGRVTDADGQALPGVTVKVTDSSGAERQVMTDVEGHYRISDLPPGSYAFSAALQGFSTETSSFSIVGPGPTGVGLDVTLEVGCLTSEVTVSMPFEYHLRHAQAVARVRIGARGELREWPLRGPCTFKGHEYLATLLDVVTAESADLRAGSELSMVAGAEQRIAFGDEAVVFLNRLPAAQRLVAGDVLPVRRGRLKTSDPSFEEFNDLPTRDALRVLRHVAALPIVPPSLNRLDDLTVPASRQLPGCSLTSSAWIGEERAALRRVHRALFTSSHWDAQALHSRPESSAIDEAYTARYRSSDGGGETEVLGVRFRDPAVENLAWSARRETAFGAIQVGTLLAAVSGPPSACLPIVAAHLRSLES